MAKIFDGILDDFVWSFSRIDSYNQCPLAFYKRYVLGNKSEKDFFSQFGDLGHNILERYAKGELVEYELSNVCKNSFYEVVNSVAPYNKYTDLKDNYYNSMLNYFDNFEGFGQRKILGIENEYMFKLDKYNMQGKIDLETDEEIIDHKSKGRLDIIRLTKNHNKYNYIQLVDGRYLEFSDLIQLYIYCIPYKEKYGKYPKRLSLNMFKINDWYTVEFNEEHLKRAENWAISEILKIYHAIEFPKGINIDRFWCDNICGQRYNCEHSSRYIDGNGV